MTFGNIYWLYAFLPILAVLLFGFYYQQKVRDTLFKSFATPPLLHNLISSFSKRRYYLKSTLYLLTVFFIFLALSQPRWGSTWESQKSKGIDILFALDVSKSMLAEDIKPNRLERAKYSILDLVKKLEGNRFGLVAFAGTAFLQCPLTLDYNAFTQCLEQADPSIFNRGGTNIAAAIRTAIPALADENNFKNLILISDGEELEESALVEARIAAKDNITIYTVGVGTAQGELIPFKTADNSIDYMRDAQGKIIKTKLDESTLKNIAEATGGFYVPLGSKGEGLDQIYESKLTKLPKQELSSTLRQLPIERFPWPIAIAICLLIIEMLFSTRRKHPQPIATLLLTGLLFNLLPNNLNASPSSAYKAFQSGQFNQAATLYHKETQKNPNDPSLNYNLGSSLYKDQNYEAALSAFNKALETQDLPLQQKAFYNLGNTTYRKGQLSLQTNPQQTTQLWDEALKYYQSSLELDPNDLESQENLDFLKKNIEKLKQQLQQQQQDQDQKNKDEQKNHNQDSNNKETQDSHNNSQQQTNNPKNNTSNETKKNESPPNNDPNQSSQNNPKNQPKKNDSANNNSNNPLSNKNANPQDASGEKSQSKQSTRLPMTQEQAEELLKTLKNSEQKLPAVSANSNDPNPYSDNFKDW